MVLLLNLIPVLIYGLVLVPLPVLVLFMDLVLELNPVTDLFLDPDQVLIFDLILVSVPDQSCPWSGFQPSDSECEQHQPSLTCSLSH